MEISINNSVRLGARNRRIRIAASAAAGLLGVALIPAAALAVGQTVDVRVAYLDPGTGSLIIQALVAMLAGAVVAISAYWRKLKTFFQRNSRDSEPSDSAPNDD